VIVNGDDVTATGLFVEHYQKVQRDLGRRARPPRSSSRTSCRTTARQASGATATRLRWAAYKSPTPCAGTNSGGGGSYIFTNVIPRPARQPRLRACPPAGRDALHDILTVATSARHHRPPVVNDTGDPVTSPPSASRATSPMVTPRCGRPSRCRGRCPAGRRRSGRSRRVGGCSSSMVRVPGQPARIAVASTSAGALPGHAHRTLNDPGADAQTAWVPGRWLR